eukprot:UN28821
MDTLSNTELIEDGLSEYGFMYKLWFNLDTEKVEYVNAYFQEGTLNWFFSYFLSTDNVRSFVCDVMENDCADVWALQDVTTHEECTSGLAALPETEDGYVDGNTQGCRALHAVFAQNNPDHCAHISLVPAEDPKGRIKCQTSAGITAEDLWTEEDINWFIDYYGSNVDNCTDLPNCDFLIGSP